jgi:hypothetical protein
MVAQLSQTEVKKPLGTVLKEAGLISDHQIQVALQDQRFDQSLLFGQILALRGWVSQETADFFAVDFPEIKQEAKREKIGFYLKKAKLLTDEQINSILQEQKHNLIRFASLAVLKGYLKQTTLDFLAENLFHGYSDSAYFMTFDPQEKTIPRKEKLVKMETKKPTSKKEPTQPETKENRGSSADQINYEKQTYIQTDAPTYIQSGRETYIQSDIEEMASEDKAEVKWIG